MPNTCSIEPPPISVGVYIYSFFTQPRVATVAQTSAVAAAVETIERRSRPNAAKVCDVRETSDDRGDAILRRPRRLINKGRRRERNK